MRAAVVSLAMGALLGLSACSSGESDVSNDGEAVRQRAVEAQTAKRRTGAEVQDRALNRIIRTVYLCENGERLSVDFDNPREMATVRNSMGEAVDMRRERATDGLWYRASGHELRGEGILATWTADGREPTDCRAID
ncbi:MliC family protein [Brevundimonas sp.]|uniref:MliC family protein n=1 Tax=Brevundimonas sp. TaxID=1871086 RepID=UPI002AB81EFA|nr:MliC family protein [Brevundimonas sp.]MDZ4362437.1 MliC family protein [Brevundimonas sp.]